MHGLKKYAKTSQDAETKRHSISPYPVREKHKKDVTKRASLIGGAVDFSQSSTAQEIQNSLDDKSTIKATLADSTPEFEDVELQQSFRDVVEAAAQAEAVLDSQTDFIDVADMDLHEQRRHLLQSTVDIFSTIVNQVNGLVASNAAAPVMSGLVPCGVQTSPRQIESPLVPAAPVMSPCGVQTSPRQAGSPLLQQAEVMRQEDTPSYIKQKIVRTVNEAVAGFGPFEQAEDYLAHKAASRSNSPVRKQNFRKEKSLFTASSPTKKTEYLSSTTNKYPTTVDEAREFFYSRAGVTPEVLQRVKHEDLGAPHFPSWNTPDRITNRYDDRHKEYSQEVQARTHQDTMDLLNTYTNCASRSIRTSSTF